MVVDWAFHEKMGDGPDVQNNFHIHVMCTTRGFNPDGTWCSMEKKTFALDEDGNRIPEIDSKTGQQKVRHRIRDGHASEEKIWKRITVTSNEWNSREQLTEWKKMWANHCNQYLPLSQQIDYRSYRQRGLDRLPQLHEGSVAREALKRGEVFDVVKENRERRAINARLDQLDSILEILKEKFLTLKESFNSWRNMYAESRSINSDQRIGRSDSAAFGSTRDNL